ncbi:uncharacterized protein C2845_PM03G08050 [Panicum miliaceum]|uniref:Uncharacterized protein n=1 Tax=Panicum miliaceum TaxID=4540 RepID=A0A3L6T7Z9_PANMI|nr:uncharacterized protein C2845_PM03G08050 [Panicum miliaceum]
MTAQYPSDLLSSIVTKLRECQQLTTDDIWAIRDLLTFQCPPNPMVNLEFLCRPKEHTQDMSDSMLLQVSSSIGHDLIADISIRRQHVPLGYISNLTYDCTFMETKLS